MATRLNKQNREGIKQDLLRYTYQPQIVRLIERKAALADAIYKHVYGDDLAKMDALPNGWLETKDHLQVKFGASYEYSYFAGYGGWSDKLSAYRYLVPEDKKKPVFKRVLQNGRDTQLIDARHLLSIEHDLIDGIQSKLLEQLKTAEPKLTQSLKAWSTIEAMIKEWPEIEPFARKYLQGGSGYNPRFVPVVNVENLNETFGLPVPTEAPVTQPSV